MSTPPRLQYDCYYHIYNRGNNRENIFLEQRNYRYFMQLYTRHIFPVAATFAYCLLRNHFHFLVRIKSVAEQQAAFEGKGMFRPKDPSQHFGNFFNAYTRSLNNTYGRTGSLFEKPFKRIKVENDVHFTRLITYIHQNPQHHGFVDDFREWPYSSYHALNTDKPTRLQRDETLEWFGGGALFEEAHLSMVSPQQVARLIPEDFD